MNVFIGFLSPVIIFLMGIRSVRRKDANYGLWVMAGAMAVAIVAALAFETP